MAAEPLEVKRGTAVTPLAGRMAAIVHDLVQAKDQIESLYIGEITIHVQPKKSHVRITESRPPVYDSEFTDDGNPPHG